MHLIRLTPDTDLDVLLGQPAGTARRLAYEAYIQSLADECDAEWEAEQQRRDREIIDDDDHDYNSMDSDVVGGL